jgi:two-component system OmpR family sensor kinase
VTLRAKLVLALGVLLALGLLAFGVGTYNRYSSSEYRRLDERLSSTAGDAERELHDRLDGFGPPGGDDHVEPGGRSLGIGSYAELRDPNGATVAQYPNTTSAPAPEVPADVQMNKPFTVGPAVGSGDWRVLASADGNPRYPGYTVIVASPLGDIAESLRGLVVIETIAGAALLALLTAGSWLILRRGLRPLEDMAAAARTIHEGDMSIRVAPGDGRGEVGQLGLALNEMLDNLQESFAARQASEAKLRQFLADASHELRTPLTSIQGFAEMFRLGVANEHVDTDVIMRRIEDESQRMRTLVEDLLLLARLDERRDVEPVVFDLAVLAADACSDAAAVDAGRPITLDAPEPVLVEGVRDHIRQAIGNLMSNALAHTPAGTAIEVTARSASGRAQIVVRDHGPGLTDEALQHAFDRFWRADQSRVGPKAGLGLAIVAAIAASHHGVATAANHPQGGAVFTIDLPLAEGNADGSEAAAVAVSALATEARSAEH